MPNEDVPLRQFTDICIAAAMKYTVNPYYLLAVAQIESGIKNIQSPSSSAFGPFQILDTTWVDFMADDDFEPEDRMEPLAQPFIAAHIAADGIAALLEKLGRKPTFGELYFAHFFGVGGAKVVLGLDPATPIRTALAEVYRGKPDAAARVDKVINGNRGLLEPQGQARKVKDVLDAVTAKLDTALNAALPAIVAALGESSRKNELVAKVTSGNTTFFVVEKSGDDDGGQMLISQGPSGNVEILAEDTTVFPIKVTAKVSKVVADELNNSFQAPDKAASPPGPSVPAGANRSQLLLAAAKNFEGTSTRDVPGTSNGNLACAWAVNEVARLAFGRPIGGQLSTQNMHAELTRTHRPALSEAQAGPGMVVISPTRNGKVGHVGIVGDLSIPRDQTPIFSNSSSRAKFMKNYTIASWRRQFAAKGLPIEYYEIKS